MPPKWIRKHLESVPPYVPGKPVEEVERELGITGALKMASNENLLGPSPKVVEAVRNELKNSHWYPESNSPKLKAVMSREFHVPESKLVLGNSGDEVLSVLFQCAIDPGDEVVYPAPSYAMYRIFAAIHDARSIAVGLKGFELDLDRLLEALTPKTRMLILCNPNNPTGTFFPHSGLEQVLKQVNGQCLVVLDEAYWEFADSPDFPRAVELLDSWPNLVILRTFSKLYGLAGFRVGFGIMEPETASFLNRVRCPFNVSRIAQVGASSAIQDKEYQNRTMQMVLEAKRFFYSELKQMGLDFVPTQANFIMADLGREAGPVCEALLRLGLIVRNLTSYGYPTCARITFGPEDWNRKLIEGLKKVL